MPSTATASVTIVNKLGLHARPAMMLVELASTFQSEIQLKRADSDEALDGKSIMQMMMLAATCGTELMIEAKGPDADEAITQLVQLVNSKFDED